MIFLYIGPGAGLTFAGSLFVILSAVLLLLVLVATWPIRLLLALLTTGRRKPKVSVRQVVVIGLDGLDPGRTRRLIDEGKMPNFAALAARGTFTDLKTTLPPMSPVAWSSFQTGTNPGKHAIFDFLNRDLRTYRPYLSSARITEPDRRGWRKWVPGTRASVRMLRKSKPFWKILGDHGLFSTILRVPISFPPEPFRGVSLSAMCTPDLRGTQGTFTLLTTDSAECKSRTGGISILLDRRGNRAEAWLPGPPLGQSSYRNGSSSSSESRVRVLLRRKSSDATVQFQIGKTRFSLKPGESSGWQAVRFPCGWGRSISGLCEFRLLSISPELRVYVSPIQIDAGQPVMPIAHPPLYSIYLRKLHGPFATLGLAEDTWGLNSDVLSEADFLDQAWRIHDERERMLFESLKTSPDGLTICVFDGPDRIQHMFYRHDVPGHPANLGRENSPHARAIDEMYARMDDLVGRVAKTLHDDALLMVISDHGFCDFSRGVNLNIWLRDHGYLTTLADAESEDYLAGVDWEKTRAYAFGLNGIYINLAGREHQGIVAPSEAVALRTEICERLTGLIDPERQTVAIRRMYDSREAYTGPYVNEGPDLIVGYEAGYRASWENAVGRVDGPLFSDNTRAWSGDHCVDPEIVPGVLLINRQLALEPGESPALIDLAPTILQQFGVPVPGHMDGRVIPINESRAATAKAKTPVQHEPAMAGSAP